MTQTLVVGATGMTGRSLVGQLLKEGHSVRVIVRSSRDFSAEIFGDPKLTVVKASILDLSDDDMKEQVNSCDAVVSCLGHVLSFKGMFGAPRQLCTEATRRLCDAIERNEPSPAIKFILMNSAGVRHPEPDKKRAGFDRAILFLLRHLLPPHRDNETAAGHLDRVVGKDSADVEWCVVRPDTLTNAEISPYDIEELPVTGVFSGRPTARSNVAKFMIDLIYDAELWRTWRFKMPVIMNAQ